MVEVVQLIRVSRSTDDYGDQVVTEESREVLALMQSISQREFYEAQAVGLKPELKLKLSDYLDYNGEPLADYQGERYHILRTFRKGKALELILTKEVNSA